MAETAPFTMVFASPQSARDFMPKDPTGRTFDWACVEIDDARLGVDKSKQLYYALDGKEQYIPDLTELLVKVDGKVIRAFISSPSAQLIKFMTDAKQKAHDTIGRLLQLFWKTLGPVPVLQIRTNYIITTEKVSGKAIYVPSGMYFDILMKELPPFWPSNLPSSHGNLRWFVTGAKVTDFAKTQAPTKQPAGRFHSALANWFKASTHTMLPALPAPGGQIPHLPTAALAMPRSRRGGERGARQREQQHAQREGRSQAETPCQFGGACRNYQAGTCKFYHGPPLEAGQVPEPAWQLAKKKGGGKAPMLPPPQPPPAGTL